MFESLADPHIFQFFLDPTSPKHIFFSIPPPGSQMEYPSRFVAPMPEQTGTMTMLFSEVLGEPYKKVTHQKNALQFVLEWVQQISFLRLLQISAYGLN